VVAVQLGPHLVHGARHVRVDVRPADPGQPEQVKFGDPVVLPVPAGPDDAQPPAGTQHPRDLGNGPLRVQPMPGGRHEHRVRAPIRQRHGLAPALEYPDLRRLLCQHGTHPRVRVDRHHLRRPPEQRPGEQPGSRG
jgi:hypothetical protein